MLDIPPVKFALDIKTYITCFHTEGLYNSLHSDIIKVVVFPVIALTYLPDLVWSVVLTVHVHLHTR